VGSLSSWSELAAGLYHTMARRTDGTLWACYVNCQSKKNKFPGHLLSQERHFVLNAA
jgi:hypothetical protein